MEFESVFRVGLCPGHARAKARCHGDLADDRRTSRKKTSKKGHNNNIVKFSSQTPPTKKDILDYITLYHISCHSPHLFD